MGDRFREIERALLEGITTLPRDNIGADFVEVSLNQISIVIAPGRLSAFTNSTRRALQQSVMMEDGNTWCSYEVPDKGMERRRCVREPNSMSQPVMGGAR